MNTFKRCTYAAVSQLKRNQSTTSTLLCLFLVFSRTILRLFPRNCVTTVR